MANILTTVRIICGLLLLRFPAFSNWYYVLYMLGGFTDAIDGTVARRLGQETRFGAKYDTAADLVFAIAVVVGLVKAVRFPTWLFVWVCVIIAIKTANLVIGFVRYKQFVAVHSAINRVCGAIVFLLPLLIGSAFAWQTKAIAVTLACFLASVAAIHESTIVFSGKALE